MAFAPTDTDYIAKLNKLAHSIFMCIPSFTTAAATRYFSPSTSSTSESDAIYVVPFDGTLTQFIVQSTAAPGAAQTFTLTVRKNTVDTSMTATIAGAATFTTGTITTNPVSVVAGDIISLKCVGSAGSAVSGFRGVMTIQP